MVCDYLILLENCESRRIRMVNHGQSTYGVKIIECRDPHSLAYCHIMSQNVRRCIPVVSFCSSLQLRVNFSFHKEFTHSRMAMGETDSRQTGQTLITRIYLPQKMVILPQDRLNIRGTSPSPPSPPPSSSSSSSSSTNND